MILRDEYVTPDDGNASGLIFKKKGENSYCLTRSATYGAVMPLISDNEYIFDGFEFKNSRVSESYFVCEEIVYQLSNRLSGSIPAEETFDTVCELTSNLGHWKYVFRTDGSVERTIDKTVDKGTYVRKNNFIRIHIDRTNLNHYFWIDNNSVYKGILVSRELKELMSDFDSFKGLNTVEENQPDPDKSPMEELDSLIGMTQLKDDVKELINLVKMQKLREDNGLKPIPMSLHLVFTGNPGTGKTTVARILSGIYKEIGVLSKGHIVETDRAGLVAGFLGQTAIKTKEVLDKAKGGILFIDEAYTLSRENDDYGQEAIDTILKVMEDERKDLVVIVAGYPDLMKNFVESNPGLRSRFNKYIEFPDYTADELEAIFYSMCAKYQYEVDEGAKETIKDKITFFVENKDDNFANAREIRNFFENIVANQASRIVNLENIDPTSLTTIMKEDIE